MKKSRGICGDVGLLMANKPLGRANRNYGRHLVRLNIGLEEPQDLIADIEQAMSRAQPPSATGRGPG